MIDLTITQNPEWIKNRQILWKPIESGLKEHFRKNEIEPIYHYFMTGKIIPGANLSEGAKFDWFPIQNTEAWDYLYQNIIQKPETFRDQFYYQFDDLTGRALTKDQELELWDYFAGNTFQPIVTSRIPIGNGNKLFSFEVEQNRIISTFKLYFRGSKGDQISENPKWKKRINYFITMMPYIKDNNFERRNKYAPFNTDIGEIIKDLFIFFMKKKIEVYLKNDPVWLEKRLAYLEEIKAMLEKVDMQPAMRQLWEETKEKYGKK